MKNRYKVVIFTLVVLSMSGMGIIGAAIHKKKSAKKLIVEKLAVLTEEEKISLAHLFNHVIKNEGFGYTIFGTKPISMSHCYDLEKCSQDHLRFLKDNDLVQFHHEINKGWLVWKKYHDCFPSKNLSMKRIGDPLKEDLYILIVNKKHFLQVVDAHLTLFQEVLSQDISSQGLLDDFLSTPFPKRDVLKNHTGLWGILFGFGKGNALLVHRKTELEKRLYPQRFDSALLLNLTDLHPSAGFQSLEEEDNFLEMMLGHISDSDCDKNEIPLPAFLADLSTKETQQLAKRYRDQREKICSVLNQEDFLEKILLQFTAK